MAQFELLAALVLISTLAAANAYVDCDPKKCGEEVQYWLDRPTAMCQNTKPVQQAILRCIRRQNTIQCEKPIRTQMLSWTSRVENSIKQHCPSVLPADATGRESQQCELGEMVGCITEFAAVLAAPNLFPLDDMAEFCRDLAQLTGSLGRCANCIGKFVGNWSVIKDEMQKATNVSLALINGGCTCAANITTQVNTIDSESTCRFVQDVSSIAKTIAVHCVVPAINSFQTFDWLTMTENLISTVLTVGQGICVFFNGGPSTVASSSIIIIGGLLLTVLLTFRINRIL